MLLQRQISTCQCRCSNHLSITFHCGHIAVSAYLKQTRVLNKQQQSRPCKQEHRCISSIPNHKYSKDVFHCVHMYARFAITDLIRLLHRQNKSKQCDLARFLGMVGWNCYANVINHHTSKSSLIYTYMLYTMCAAVAA